MSIEAAEEARMVEAEIRGQKDRVELELKKQRLKQSRVGRKSNMCLATIAAILSMKFMCAEEFWVRIKFEFPF